MPHFFIAALTLALTGSLIHPVHGFFRIPCGSRLMDQRMDSIVTPGEPSGHVHTIAGGNGMVSLLDVAMLSLLVNLETCIPTTSHVFTQRRKIHF